MRKESDFIGSANIPKMALYGIHSLRAKSNFPGNIPFPMAWFKALGMVKMACYNTIERFIDLAANEYPEKLKQLHLPNSDVLKHMSTSASEISSGQHIEHFIIPAVQGGAGTSINMNINEIVANVSLLRMNQPCGNYQIVDPIEHCNLFQSTNDVVPTALKVALMNLLNKLEEGINESRKQMEELESQNRNALRLAYTQMQQAVPSTFGQLFGAYNDALGRDWWRVSKCFERIKTVNLGGGATGTGVGIPRFFIMEVVQELKRLTGLPVTQSENLTETTSNLDSLVEVHAILKSCAVNLEKMSSDIRLLAADITGKPDISIPPRQIGSSIMPGKVNPVIPEYIVSAAHKIYANDMLIGNLCGMGTLELNAYLPQIGCAMIESLELLIGCYHTLTVNLLAGLKVNHEIASEKLFKSPAICTVLSPAIGYNAASQLAYCMKSEGKTVQEANDMLQLLPLNKLEEYLKPGYLMQKGFSLRDI